MTRLLGEALKRPTFMPPVPGFMIRLLMGEFGSVLLEGQRVIPRELLGKGFQFQFPNLREALGDLLR
jgi:NAD dependent epimerase/dehydratase family enzyme